MAASKLWLLNISALLLLAASVVKATPTEFTRNPAPSLVTEIDPSSLDEHKSDVERHVDWLIRAFRRFEEADRDVVEFQAALSLRCLDVSVPIELRRFYFSQLGQLTLTYFEIEAEKGRVPSVRTVLIPGEVPIRFVDVLNRALLESAMKEEANAVSKRLCDNLEAQALSNSLVLSEIIYLIRDGHFGPAVRVVERITQNEGEPQLRKAAATALLSLLIEQGLPDQERAILLLASQFLQSNCELQVLKAALPE